MRTHPLIPLVADRPTFYEIFYTPVTILHFGVFFVMFHNFPGLHFGMICSENVLAFTYGFRFEPGPVDEIPKLTLPQPPVTKISIPLVLLECVNRPRPYLVRLLYPPLPWQRRSTIRSSSISSHKRLATNTCPQVTDSLFFISPGNTKFSLQYCLRRSTCLSSLSPIKSKRPRCGSG